MKRIVFFPAFYGDIKPLMNLYDYLRKNGDDVGFMRSDIESLNNKYLGISDKWFKNVNTYEAVEKSDLIINCYAGHKEKVFYSKNLEIDISLLKNCSTPLTLEERIDLRKKYGVPGDSFVAVLGHADNCEPISEEIKLITEVLESEKSLLYLVSFKKLNFPWLDKKSNIINITEFGVLKDLYALANVSFFGDNISEKLMSNGYIDSRQEMHDFVEATENGPLFIVYPPNTYQYGYLSLTNKGVIKEFEEFSDLIGSLSKYEFNKKDNEKLLVERKKHIRGTRDKYLKVIKSHIHHLLYGDQFLNSELEFLKIDKEREVYRLRHKETDWDRRFC